MAFRTFDFGFRIVLLFFSFFLSFFIIFANYTFSWLLFDFYIFSCNSHRIELSPHVAGTSHKRSALKLGSSGLVNVKLSAVDIDFFFFKFLSFFLLVFVCTLFAPAGFPEQDPMPVFYEA